MTHEKLSPASVAALNGAENSACLAAGHERNHTTGCAAGLAAGRAWFAQIRKTMGDYRDTERSAFVRGLGAEDSDAALASLEFDQGFARAVAEAFSGARHG
ncbi:hypothetical protein AVE30378_05632 [Achromobacter veterisilvae]|uniref:Uncharacterized protein n=1 Tax=Achromobacter veterisilvae TaxID=2069367 RepID=A0A446CZJ9_9BURK|nr:hypothetical protein AVE30378_05632 [Achromobacter veterisilvae]